MGTALPCLWPPGLGATSTLSDARLLVRKQEHVFSWLRQAHNFLGKVLFCQVQFYLVAV